MDVDDSVLVPRQAIEKVSTRSKATKLIHLNEITYDFKARTSLEPCARLLDDSAGSRSLPSSYIT